MIANGYLQLDREEWVRVVEKRQAALHVASGSKSGSIRIWGSPPRRETPGQAARPTGFDPAISALTGR